MTYMHLNDQRLTTLNDIANHLNVSKIYLEQVFTHLKQAELVDAVKGPTGGYFLTEGNCTMYQVLYALEPTLFEKTPASTDDNSINKALCDNVYTLIDLTLKDKLSSIKLKDVAKEIKDQNLDAPMYYI